MNKKLNIPFNITVELPVDNLIFIELNKMEFIFYKFVHIAMVIAEICQTCIYDFHYS